MRKVNTRAPSFPAVTPNQPIDVAPGVRWQVLCGDRDHWRVGLYSPTETSSESCRELERHDCPEFFLLQHGRLILVLAEEGRLRELPLESGRAVLVTCPHSGYCPDGPHGGSALVIERDSFETEYRAAPEW